MTLIKTKKISQLLDSTAKQLRFQFHFNVAKVLGVQRVSVYLKLLFLPNLSESHGQYTLCQTS